MTIPCSIRIRGQRPGRQRALGWLGALMVLVYGALGSATSGVAAQMPTAAVIAGARAPHGNGLIAFTSNRSANDDIYVMATDGSGQTDLTNNSASDSQPAWSPGGTAIAFTSDRTGDSDVYVMNADGSGVVDLTNNSASDSQPSWSPDGSRLAFTSDRSGNNDVYVMNADGSGVADLTNNSASDSDPAWSPTGTRIAFTSNRSGNNEVYVMKSNGSGSTDLTNDTSSDSQPAWSPGGTEIAFTSDRTGNSDIFVMNLDGSGQTDLSNNPAADTEPFFSPDQGTRLGFTTMRSGSGEVYLMDALDGSDQTDLTHNSATESGGDWQPLAALPPNGSPIKHVVVIDMENHSFDNVLGLLCAQAGRCDGATSGEIADGTVIPLAQARDLVPVVAHEHGTQITAIRKNQMNGFSLISGCTVETGYACYSQFSQSQIPTLWGLASTFVISDRTFEQNTVATWGSHLELVASQLDGFDTYSPRGLGGFGWGCDSGDTAPWHATQFDVHSLEPSCIPQIDGSGPSQPSPVPWVPTIMDRLDGAKLTWRLYAPHIGDGLSYGWAVCPTFADCFYTSETQNWVSPDQFATDAAAGSLPSLSVLLPVDANSQHNSDSMLQGDNWIATNVNAVMGGPEWDSTAIFITYDDCGCFYDHVPPPRGMGIRVPMVIVSPYAVPGYTDTNVASFASILAFTEHTFGLAPLSVLDADAYDYSLSFNYGQRPLPPIRFRHHPVPAWELRWIRNHPGDPNDPT